MSPILTWLAHIRESFKASWKKIYKFKGTSLSHSNNTLLLILVPGRTRIIAHWSIITSFSSDVLSNLKGIGVGGGEGKHKKDLINTFQ